VHPELKLFGIPTVQSLVDVQKAKLGMGDNVEHTLPNELYKWIKT
jgi:hypothetical protein